MESNKMLDVKSTLKTNDVVFLSTGDAAIVVEFDNKKELLVFGGFCDNDVSTLSFDILDDNLACNYENHLLFSVMRVLRPKDNTALAQLLAGTHTTEDSYTVIFDRTKKADNKKATVNKEVVDRLVNIFMELLS